MQIPSAIDEWNVLYYTETAPYRSRLQRYLPEVPPYWLLVYDTVEKSYSIIGTDAQLQQWDRFRSYVFKDLESAMEAPVIIFRLQDLQWKPVK